MQIVIGKHYGLRFDGNPAPAIIKVYNVEPDGTVGGDIFNVLTGEIAFSKGFRPKGELWEGFNQIPVECIDRDGVVEVRVENLDEELMSQDALNEIERVAKIHVTHFFTNDVSKPLYEFMDDVEKPSTWLKRIRQKLEKL